MFRISPRGSLISEKLQIVGAVLTPGQCTASESKVVLRKISLRLTCATEQHTYLTSLIGLDGLLRCSYHAQRWIGGDLRIHGLIVYLATPAGAVALLMCC